MDVISDDEDEDIMEYSQESKEDLKSSRDLKSSSYSIRLNSSASSRSGKYR